MEADMDMELEEDDLGGGVFVFKAETDFECEFDASRFFDFCRAETAVEAREAELWFETAGSYPPSPFIARVSIGKEFSMENSSGHMPFDMEKNMNSCGEQPFFMTHLVPSKFDERSQGTVLLSLLHNDIPRVGRKIATVSSLSRGSSLLKPTASQLAKQKRWQDVKNVYQLGHRRLAAATEKSLEDSTDNLYQAPKRQKLDNGNSHKLEAIGGVKQLKDFIHKVPGKLESANCDSLNSRLKLTIPREPEFQTTQRARRPRIHVQSAKKEQETISKTQVFKALPLNRKILEAPSFPQPQKSKPQLPEFKEFKLMTAERALHYLKASAPLVKRDHIHSSDMQACAEVRELSHCQNISASRLHNPMELDRSGNLQVKFKALPLDKKVFSSKGDTTVFHSAKRELTVPKEFNFATSKRSHQNPPVDLFSKLSLNSEAQQKAASTTNFLQLPTKFSQSSSTNGCKASKENIAQPLQQENKDREHRRYQRRLVRHENNGVASCFRLDTSASRSLGIR